jgi:hypothetical protein
MSGNLSIRVSSAARVVLVIPSQRSRIIAVLVKIYLALIIIKNLLKNMNLRFIKNLAVMEINKDYFNFFSFSFLSGK